MQHIRISNSGTDFRAAHNDTQHAQQYYSRALFEASVDAIVITDTQGNITDVNQQMVDISGCARSQLIGTSWFCFCPDATAATAAFGRALTEDRVSNTALTLKSCDGTETPIAYNAAPIYDHQTNLVGVFATLRDATELNQMRQALKAKQVDVDQANKMKSDFLATMSHELRTPLTAILGFSEALVYGVLGTLHDGQKEYVQNIHKSGQHLLNLVSDILDLAKMNAGMMDVNFETANIADVLVQSVTRNTRQLATQGIALQLDAGPDPLVAQIDLRKTQKIIDHMLSNAVKFSAPNGDVRIQACRVPRSSVGKLGTAGALFGVPLVASDCDEFIQLTIHDNGVGMAEESLSKAYELFTQADSGLNRPFEGAGLGVSMVQRLAELHGGTSAIASAQGEGTSFAVWLPVRIPHLKLAYSASMAH